MLPSAMWLHVGLIRKEVLEEFLVSLFRLEGILQLGTTLTVTSSSTLLLLSLFRVR
jgi:hypothetical protein